MVVYRYDDPPLLNEFEPDERVMLEALTPLRDLARRGRRGVTEAAGGV